MRYEDFSDRSPGRMVRVRSRGGAEGWAFIPDPLPETYEFDTDTLHLLERAQDALGRINALGEFIPNPHIIVHPFVRREALASTRIEGTRAEYDQLVIFEAMEKDASVAPDIQEVLNYVNAMSDGWRRPEERPITTSFIRELHQQLMAGVRGEQRRPGALRETLVWIGGQHRTLEEARFVPPPPEFVEGLLDDLNNYTSRRVTVPSLVKLALIHYQFETIHPFEDGNGRLGRLLMPLILNSWSFLRFPMLYLSEYFEQHRDAYIDSLYAVSSVGDWKRWVTFTLTAIEVQARDAASRAEAVLNLREAYRERYRSASSVALLSIIDRLFEHPVTTVADAQQAAGTSYSSANSHIKRLVNDGVLTEVTGQRRNRLFLAGNILRTSSGMSRSSER